jgi:hypothetical protein
MRGSKTIKFIRIITIAGRQEAIVAKAHWSKYEEKKKPPAHSQAAKENHHF